MSFFDDNKNIGLLVLILGLVTILGGIFLMLAIIGGETRSVAGAALFLVGALICGLLQFITGLNIRDSNEKVGGGSFPYWEG